MTRIIWIAFIATLVELFTHFFSWAASRLFNIALPAASAQRVHKALYWLAGALGIFAVTLTSVFDYESSRNLPQPMTSPGRAPSSSHESLDELQSLFDQLRVGKIEYNPPGEMTLDHRETISVRVHGPGETADALAAASPMAGHGERQIHGMRVAPRMTVTLSGDNFDVRTSSSRVQFVPERGFAEWVFHVEPHEEGDQELLLQSSVVLTDGAETELPSITAPIHVKVLPSQQFQHFVEATDLWKWILGILGSAIVGIGGFLLNSAWKRYRARKRTRPVP